MKNLKLGSEEAINSPYLKRQHPKKVFGPIGEPTFRFGTKPSEGTICNRSEHRSTAKVTLTEHAGGAITDDQSAKTRRIAANESQYSGVVPEVESVGNNGRKKLFEASTGHSPCLQITVTSEKTYIFEVFNVVFL